MIQMIGFVGMINSMLFLLIELVWAESIKELALKNSETNLLLLIVMGGFVISIAISVLSSLLGAQSLKEKQKVWIAALVAFLLNFIGWIAVSYITVLKNYPDILQGLGGFEKIVVFPKMMMNYSLYVLSNFTLLWLYAGWTQVILYVILLKSFHTQVSTKLKKYDKMTFW